MQWLCRALDGISKPHSLSLDPLFVLHPLPQCSLNLRGDVRNVLLELGPQLSIILGSMGSSKSAFTHHSLQRDFRERVARTVL